MELHEAGISIELVFTHSHVGIGVNCVVDELINATWKKLRNEIIPDTLPLVQHTHKEIKSIIRKRMEE